MTNVMLGMALAALFLGVALFGKKQTERAAEQAYRRGFEDGANIVLEKFHAVTEDYEQNKNG